MEARLNGTVYTVLVTNAEVSDFAATWPGNHFDRDAEYVFEFDVRNGDLVDINAVRDSQVVPTTEDEDGPEFVAMSEDAGKFGAEALGLDAVVAIRYPSALGMR